MSLSEACLWTPLIAPNFPGCPANGLGAALGQKNLKILLFHSFSFFLFGLFTLNPPQLLLTSIALTLINHGSVVLSSHEDISYLNDCYYWE